MARRTDRARHVAAALGSLSGRLLRTVSVYGAIVAVAYFVFRSSVGEPRMEARAAASGDEDALSGGPRTEPDAPEINGGTTLRSASDLAVRGLGFGADGRRIHAVLASGEAASWDVATGEAGRSREFGGYGIIHASSVGGWRTAVVVGVDNQLRALTLPDGEAVAARRLDKVSLGRPRDVFLAGAVEGSLVAHVNLDREVQVVDLKQPDRRIEYVVDGGEGTPVIALSRDGRLLALGYAGRSPRSNVVEVRDTISGRLIVRADGHEGAVTAVAFSADASRVISTGKDRTLRVWDAASGREVRRLGLLPGVGNCLAISAREPVVLVGTGHQWTRGSWSHASRHGTEVWNFETGEILGRFDTPGPVTSVDVSPDGRLAVSAEEAGAIHVWRMPGATSVSPEPRENREVAAVAR